MIMKQNKEKFDFKAFGQAIKAARKAKGISRNQLADKLNIAPRYIASIENSGQHPSLQILYELVTLLDVSVSCAGKTGCPLSFRVKAVREKAMQNIKRKRREQVGKAS